MRFKGNRKKVVPHFLVGLVLFFAEVFTANADEPLPIFDPKVHEIASIKILIKEGEKTEFEVLVFEKINETLKDNLITLAVANTISHIESGFDCNKEKNQADFLEAFDKTLLIFVTPDSNPKFNLTSKITFCHSEVGKVRLLFPENWVERFPKSPIRLGDCAPKEEDGEENFSQIIGHENIKNFAQYIFCRVQPDINLVGLQIAEAKEQ